LLKKIESDFDYKPVCSDPIDVKLSSYINATPLLIRTKMNFKRES